MSVCLSAAHSDWLAACFDAWLIVCNVSVCEYVRECEFVRADINIFIDANMKRFEICAT